MGDCEARNSSGSRLITYAVVHSHQVTACGQKADLMTY